MELVKHIFIHLSLFKVLIVTGKIISWGIGSIGIEGGLPPTDKYFDAVFH
ncbi:hypothetical protein [Flavobacterium sp.]|nr:hypothetical protein [Flavobacterium sp.]